MLKIDCNTGRTQDWTARAFITCLARLSIILCYDWFRFVYKRLFKRYCLKSFLNAKVSSPMIECISHSFRSDGHCQCCRPHCQSMLGCCCDPCVSLEPRTVTHFKLTVPPLQMSSNDQYISWIQSERELNDKYIGIWNEQFYWHFPSKLCGRKKTKLMLVCEIYQTMIIKLSVQAFIILFISILFLFSLCVMPLRCLVS